MKKATSIYKKSLQRGIPLLDLGPRLSDGKTYLLASYPLFHSISVETLETSLRKIRSISEELLSEIHKRESKRREKIYVLLIFWFYSSLSQ